MDLEGLGLDKDAKIFISSIVDNYVLGKKYLSDGSNPFIITPGTQVHNIFAEVLGKYVFNISLHKENDSDVEVYYIFNPKLIDKNDNEDDYHAEERFLKIKKTEFIYKITLLKSLFDSGYINLIDDKNWNLFFTGKITDYDKERWVKNGIHYRHEIIKSQMIFDFISQFHSCTIIPSPQLINYRYNRFRTPEQRRFRINSILSWIAIGVSILIGIGSPWLMTRFSKTSIEQAQIEAILDAIPKQVEDVKINQEQIDSIIMVLNKGMNKNNGQTQNAKP